MKVYKKDSGKRFVPQGHANITARMVFNAENGCLKASVLLSTLPVGSGMDEEVHEHSDQIFYVFQGHVNAFSNKEQIATLSEGDAIHVSAGESHSFSNQEEQECKLLVVTVPPVDKTR
jgi:quercetin dioxygenase-like cupin family protein